MTIVMSLLDINKEQEITSLIVRLKRNNPLTNIDYVYD